MAANKFHLKKILLYPFLFAIYPVLFLYSQNIGEVPSSYLFSPIVFAITITAFLYAVFQIVLKNHLKTSLTVTLFNFLFYSYGQVVLWIGDGSVGGFKIADNPAYLILFALIIFLTVFYFLAKTKHPLLNLTKIVSLVIGVLILFSLLDISIKIIKFTNDDRANPASQSTIVNETNKKSQNNLPNIYYIILDGYGREDILAEKFGFQNNEFIDFLEKKGFYVAKQSSTNYGQTALSLSSSLNFRYLDEFKGKNNDNRLILGRMINANKTTAILKNFNYQIITYSTGYPFTEIKNSDQYLEPSAFWNYFLIECFNLTPLSLVQKNFRWLDPSREHISRILFNFDSIAKISNQAKPFFVFSHILAPHPPFIFNADGLINKNYRLFSTQDGTDLLDQNPEEVKKYRQNYLEQLQFVNNKTEKMLNQILNNARRSNRPTVIIMQADHGPGSNLFWKSVEKTDLKERMSIFNAYYFSDQSYQKLYPSITPVNSFRIIFNQYFDAHYPLLDDKNYFSLWKTPYQFIDVTNKVRP